MFCFNCGKEIDDKAVICVHCGCPMDKKPREHDAPSMGFAVLGFLVPMVGLILYLIYNDTCPLRARSAGKGALIGFIASIVLTVLIVILYVIGFGFMINAMTETVIY